MIGYAQYVETMKNDIETDSILVPQPPKYRNGPGMLPLLPPETKGVRGKEVARNAKEIIRAFFQRHYSLSFFIQMNFSHVLFY